MDAKELFKEETLSPLLGRDFTAKKTYLLGVWEPLNNKSCVSWLIVYRCFHSNESFEVESKHEAVRCNA